MRLEGLDRSPRRRQNDPVCSSRVSSTILFDHHSIFDIVMKKFRDQNT